MSHCTVVQDLVLKGPSLTCPSPARGHCSDKGLHPFPCCTEPLTLNLMGACGPAVLSKVSHMPSGVSGHRCSVCFLNGVKASGCCRVSFSVLDVYQTVKGLWVLHVI